MILLITGVAIFALLIASYSQRCAWVAWCSTAMSIAAFAGFLSIPMVEDPSKVRASLTWLFRQLPLVLDQATLDDLAAAIRPGSPAAKCDAKNRPGCATAASHSVSPIALNNEIPRRSLPPEPGKATQAGTTIKRPVARRDAADASGFPVIWRMDESSAASGVAPRFLIGGTNISNATLQKVRATLKPDATQREVELALKVSGNRLEDGDAIPAGSRFTLGLATATTNNENLVDGAIFAFRYTYVGQQRAMIWYLSPTMIARLAKLE